MNILNEARRRYGSGGPFVFPECPSCSAKPFDITFIEYVDGGMLLECDECGETWRLPTDREIAVGLLGIIEKTLVDTERKNAT